MTGHEFLYCHIFTLPRPGYTLPFHIYIYLEVWAALSHSILLSKGGKRGGWLNSINTHTETFIYFK